MSGSRVFVHAEMIGGSSVVGSAGVCVGVAFSIGMSGMTDCVGCGTGFTGMSH